jgi:hypothetical protein
VSINDYIQKTTHYICIKKYMPLFKNAMRQLHEGKLPICSLDAEQAILQWVRVLLSASARLNK